MKLVVIFTVRLSNRVVEKELECDQVSNPGPSCSKGGSQREDSGFQVMGMIKGGQKSKPKNTLRASNNIPKNLWNKN